MSGPTPFVETILGLFERRGASEYGREAVTQLEHALQCAALAQNEKAPDTLVAAALLHDIGHLLHDLDRDAPDRGIDDMHEALGGEWLAERAPAAVVAPVRLHVAAKRYLCAVNPAYYDGLSPASRQSLGLQGGPMSPEEAETFRENRYWRESLRLRVWDDKAKVPGAVTPTLDELSGVLERAFDEAA